MQPRSALFLAVLVAAVHGQSPGPIVNLGYAQYQGVNNDTTGGASWLGVRYAAPPIGQLRFAAPQAPANVNGTQQAASQPDICRQVYSSGTGPTSPYLNVTGVSKRDSTTPPESEDCLFLNVYTPVDVGKNATASLPVIVWIHGGGYLFGAAFGQAGKDLVDESDNGVVVVVIQYRLGVFGFLSGNEVVEGGGALNAGLLDQTFALQWVQDHIAKFGGDPAKVTIWGESAGAGSVLQHIVSNGGNSQPPLFRAAMTSSTFLPSQYAYNDSIPEAIYQQFVKGVGCDKSEMPYACLRNVSADTLNSVNTDVNVNGFYGTFTTAPVVDGKLIVERPIETLLKGNVNGEVLLAVMNSDEGASFVNPNETYAATDYVQNVYPHLSAEDRQKVADAYANYTIAAGEGVPVGAEVTKAIGIMGESVFYCPSYYLLEAFNKSGKKAWKGLFAIPPGYHGNDVEYYFTSLSGGPPYNILSFVDSFSKSFSGVAISLDPNAHVDSSDVTPTWNTWAQGHVEMIFNITETNQTNIAPRVTDPSILSRCSLWQTLGQYTGQ
ncbi:alpha beta-hydrolase [Coniophora puteana RWD-64-598 SS2]|uniref:Carboxylic ester hydrolase n=1 Tax=Coniophora puteana (strain RWD-64-598) TaxID=741705 RepID=A0A5M3MY33_CONPW|nr:alpha beta-hydrolase [Coniophora puteana RWD-64-598 SS2]EIW83635.1 alpha beta-hydrolase [Coniophora puteana RWD-64-598 SS2]